MILPCQENSSLPDTRQQAAHLLHEHKLDDKILQKAQLKQHETFQNYPTSPSPAAPSAPPPCNRRQTEVHSTQGQRALRMTLRRLLLTLKLMMLP